MPIGYAIKRGQQVTIFDEHRQVIGLLAASGPDDCVKQCTNSTVTVRQGNQINTYEWRSGGLHNIVTVDVDPVERLRITPAPQPSLSRNPQQPRTTNANKDSTAGIALILFAFVAILLLTPGMSVVGALRTWLSASWDTGQMWMFAVVMSALIWTGLFAISRKWRKASIQYLLLCAAIVVLFGFAHFPMNFDFPAETVARFFPALVKGADAGDGHSVAILGASHSAILSRPAEPSPVVAPEPITYRVSGVREGDYLNVRQGPGSNYPTVTRLRMDTGGIILGTGRVANGTTVWQQISVNGMSGWVNSDFISAETPVH